MAHQVIAKFALLADAEGNLPDYGMEVLSGRLRLDSVAYKSTDSEIWVELTYVRPWYMRMYLTVRGWFIDP